MAEMNEKDFPFAVEDIVQTPLPGYVAPTAVSFSPDDSLVSYLFSPQGNLNRRVYTFDVKNGESSLVFSPPDGGVDESNISPEDKLRRERLRERGLGVTWYEWIKTNLKMKFIVVPLPAGVCFLFYFPCFYYQSITFFVRNPETLYSFIGIITFKSTHMNLNFKELVQMDIAMS